MIQSEQIDNYSLISIHLWICDKGNFTIFPFLQPRASDTDLRRECKAYFIKKTQTKPSKENNWRINTNKNCKNK